MKTEAFYCKVRQKAAPADLGVERATAAVFHALRDRLTPEEADQVVAQLPRELKAVWEMGEQAERQPLKIRRGEFYERVRAEAGLASSEEAHSVTLAVFAALKEQLSPGEANDVLAQLPKDLKEVWMDA